MSDNLRIAGLFRIALFATLHIPVAESADARLRHASNANAAGPQCAAYMAAKNLATPAELAQKVQESSGVCQVDADKLATFHPDPKPNFKGVTDTTSLSCKYGTDGSTSNTLGPAACGWRPHFNWIVSTCEDGTTIGQFCKDVPKKVQAEGAKINYVAAYQFDGEHFQLVDDSSAGDLSDTGIAGNFVDKSGWERRKANFSWKGGDWTTKYAPWTRKGVTAAQGPRGLTPPASLFVLSVENFYYGAFYMLPQMTLNLQGQGRNGENESSWTWELDPVEGTAGWTPGKGTIGNLNMLYATSKAQETPCMPVAWTNGQTNGRKKEFRVPEEFVDFCKANSSAIGCDLNTGDVWWSGGNVGTNRFENKWDEPYVFAVVIDQLGYWTYRWRPEEDSGATGWPGVNRFNADRKLAARPIPVSNPEGLKTDVADSVAEAVIFMPGLQPEAACLRASCEAVDAYPFGASALGALADELSAASSSNDQFEGALNWWAHYADTKQMTDTYPLSIAGLSPSMLFTQYDCNTPSNFGAACSTHRKGGPPGHWSEPVAPSGGGGGGGSVTIILILSVLGVAAFLVLAWGYRYFRPKRRELEIGEVILEERLQREAGEEGPHARPEPESATSSA